MSSPNDAPQYGFKETELILNLDRHGMHPSTGWFNPLLRMIPQSRQQKSNVARTSSGTLRFVRRPRDRLQKRTKRGCRTVIFPRSVTPVPHLRPHYIHRTSPDHPTTASTSISTFISSPTRIAPPKVVFAGLTPSLRKTLPCTFTTSMQSSTSRKDILVLTTSWNDPPREVRAEEMMSKIWVV